MSLKEKTNLIKSYSTAVKSNFIKIGKVLIEIRDKKLFNENYPSFTQYLIGADFQFTRDMAYKLMDVYKEFGEDNKKIEGLGITKLVELTYVKDKEVREELIEKAQTLTRDELRKEVKKVKEEDLFKQIKRKSQRENQDVYVESDDPLAKCKRQAQNILQDIQRLAYPINDMETRLNKWIEFSKKFKDKDIMQFKKTIDIEWKKIRTIKKSKDSWFD
ncbi:hypothetical protein LCGC14_0862860 [marine sediment metagenome]|uniref:DUF3102 domain-containing protein n=1 Tax=marine sediment metagenome TaxID=412755 RepID=A0A0F9PBU2_9ZZZZ